MDVWQLARNPRADVPFTCQSVCSYKLSDFDDHDYATRNWRSTTAQKDRMRICQLFITVFS